MKKLFLSTLLGMFISLIGFSQTVLDVVVNSPNHNTLETAVIAAGLNGALAGEGPFTVFAPTDAAFGLIDPATINALLADPQGALTDVLLNHVVSGVASSDNISDGLVIGNLATENLTFTVNGNGVFINDIQVSVVDIKADNGIVHVIDAVIVPPAPTTVLDVVVNSPDHTQLESLVIAAGLDGALSGDGPFTVFAPTDAAFAALPAEVVDALVADPTGALAEVLLYHVVSGVAVSSSLSDGQQFGTLLGSNITVRIDDSGVFINDAQVTVADIHTDNGVVHVVDAVIVPPAPTTVLGVVVNSPDHTQLESLVIAAGLDGALAGAGPFTVFAPTDAAFAALPAEVVNALVADPTGALADVLLYHVVSGVAVSSSLSDGQQFGTLLGNNVRVSIDSKGVFINDAQVTVADIHTDNGVVHVIDAVLVP